MVLSPLPLTTKPPKLNPGSISQALLHHSCFGYLSSALMADDQGGKKLVVRARNSIFAKGMQK